MAGDIRVRENPLELWTAANWAFDFVLRELRPLVPDGGFVAQELDRIGHPNELKYLDITVWSLSDRAQLADAAHSLARVMRENGPGSMHSPEFFPGLLERVEELGQKVSAR